MAGRAQVYEASFACVHASNLLNGKRRSQVAPELKLASEAEAHLLRERFLRQFFAHSESLRVLFVAAHSVVRPSQLVLQHTSNSNRALLSPMRQATLGIVLQGIHTTSAMLHGTGAQFVGVPVPISPSRTQRPPTTFWRDLPFARVPRGGLWRGAGSHQWCRHRFVPHAEVRGPRHVASAHGAAVSSLLGYRRRDLAYAYRCHHSNARAQHWRPAYATPHPPLSEVGA
mmetsp:Transcript_63197/g.178510  ORF Transcript_63197/g.178510 Transcript_63197/m.178510 type:complete len:228 (-) Transcript_63197:2-685(-)